MEKVKMKIELEVTKAQGLALQAMFEYMNQLSNLGGSREVGFYADGDGNFHPKAKITFNSDMPELTDELKKISIIKDDSGNRIYDFDPIAWKINH